MKTHLIFQEFLDNYSGANDNQEIAQSFFSDCLEEVCSTFKDEDFSNYLEKAKKENKTIINEADGTVAASIFESEKHNLIVYLSCWKKGLTTIHTHHFAGGFLNLSGQTFEMQYFWNDQKLKIEKKHYLKPKMWNTLNTSNLHPHQLVHINDHMKTLIVRDKTPSRGIQRIYFGTGDYSDLERGQEGIDPKLSQFDQLSREEILYQSTKISLKSKLFRYLLQNERELADYFLEHAQFNLKINDLSEQELISACEKYSKNYL